MFDIIRNNPRVAQGILAVLILPFAFFGLDSLVLERPGRVAVAEIDKLSVTQREFDESLRVEGLRMKEQLKERFNPESAKTPMARQAVLDAMIVQRLLLLEQDRLKMPLASTIRRAIAEIPEFQKEGVFSQELYEQSLAEKGRTVADFEQEVRRYFTEQRPPILVDLALTPIISDVAVNQLVDLQAAQREVKEYRILPELYLKDVKLEEDEAKKFYDEEDSAFQSPERIKLDYLVLALDDLEISEPTEAEVTKWYEDHKTQYTTQEERQASHILFLTQSAGNDEAKKAEVKTKAEAILKTAQENPDQFSQLAKKHSEDSGSAVSGGDLGVISRGSGMVQPFEDAVFTLKEGQVSDLVETEFGYHIIKLASVTPAIEKPFSEVSGDIKTELREHAAKKKFAEQADAFGDMVYEQPDSLESAAETFKLEIKKSDWIARGASIEDPILGHAKLREAIFSDDTLKDGNNTPAIEVKEKTIVAARVAEHIPEAKINFEVVKSSIEEGLRLEKAAVLAKAEGEKKLAELKTGKDTLKWLPKKKVSALAPLLDLGSMQAVFKLPTDKFPAYTGVALSREGSYHIFKLESVSQAKLEEKQRQAIEKRIRGAMDVQILYNYTQALKEKYKVKIDHKRLFGDDESAS